MDAPAFVPIRSTAIKELGIATRFRAVRNRQALSQAILAQQIGLSRDQVANVEYGRASLRMWPGWRFCKFTDTHPVWLATGGGPEKPCVRVYVAMDGLEDFLFSEFVALNRDLLEGAPTERYQHAANFSDEQLADYVRSLAKYWFSKTTGDRRQQLQDLLFRAGSEFVGNARFFEGGEHNFSDDPESASQPAVDSPDLPATVPLVAKLSPPFWQHLRETLVARTDHAGGRADLARAMKVSRQTVFKWLTGKGCPDAEHALELLFWAFPSPRAENRDPARVVARTGPEGPSQNQ